MATTGENMGRGAMFPGAAAATSMRPLSEVFAYWDALRGGRPLPLRSDVDPRGIEGALEHTFVLERIAPQVSRFRLAGGHLNDLMGMEVRGMPVTSLFAPAWRNAAAVDIDRVFQDPAIAEFDLDAETAFGRPPLKARLMILPLRSDLGDVTRALGCLVADGHIGRTPRRFEFTGSRIRPVAAGRTVAQVVPPSALEVAGDRPNRGLAEARAVFRPSPGLAPRGRTHLRLVKADG